MAYRSPAGFSLKVPEGWARTDRATGVRFADKFDTIDVTVEGRTEPLTSASVRTAEARQLESGGRAVTIGPITTVQLPAGSAVLIKYTSNSEPNAVTGKQIRLEHDRYLITHAGKLATIDLSAPAGADNADQWRLMSRSFAW